MHISLVNVHASNSQKIKINIDGGDYKNITVRILQSARVQDCNTFEKTEVVVPKPFSGAKLAGNELEVVLPPFSVVVLEIK